LDDLGDIGHNIFGGILPADEPVSRPSESKSLFKKTSTSQGTAGSSAPRAGSTLGSTADSLSAPKVLIPKASSSTTSSSGTSSYNQTIQALTTRNDAAAGAKDKDVAIGGKEKDSSVITPLELKEKAAQAKPTPTNLRPLHERMSVFQQSGFSNEPQSTPSAAGASHASSSTSLGTGGVLGSTGTSALGSAGTVGATAATPSVAPTKPVIPVVPSRIADLRSVENPIRSPDPTPAERPATVPIATTGAKSETAAQTAGQPAPVEPKAPGKAEQGKKPQENVLISRKSPILGVETVGPRKITVGKEAAFEVQITNAGEVAAEEVVVFVELPAWADVAGAETSMGIAQSAVAGEASRPMHWKIGALAANGKEKLLLRIIPRESRPFDLAVRWDYKPAASQTMIEVQEPKLAVHMDGPREVFFGKKETFAVKLANTGNGDADNVVVSLVTGAAGENPPILHKIGLLAAGEQKSLAVELTARQVGDLNIRVDVHGDGNAHAELAEKVLVRRAALQMAVEGPQVQYIGTTGVFRIRVTNPGNAPAKNIKFTASIPPGGKYISGIDNVRGETNNAKVQWTIDALNPNTERTFEMKCNLALAGANKVDVIATAEDDLTVAGGASTWVDAMADLALEVKDPGQPIALSNDAVYELHVRNRGSKGAEGVEIVAFFAEGVEPVAVEGLANKIMPGQVVFQPIPTIGPGSEVVLKIRAKAEMAGNHAFRVEVHCKPLSTRLVSEQTTHFYQDSSAPLQASRPAPAGSASQAPSAAQMPRTADRRDLVAPPAARNEPIAAPLKR
jgi:uncharacterized repeat protein (TIGR01451 family)